MVITGDNAGGDGGQDLQDPMAPPGSRSSVLPDGRDRDGNYRGPELSLMQEHLIGDLLESMYAVATNAADRRLFACTIDNSGNKLVQLTAFCARPIETRALLEAGCAVASTVQGAGNRGNRPRSLFPPALWCAAYAGCVRTVEVLLEYGAECGTATDRWGNSSVPYSLGASLLAPAGEVTTAETGPTAADGAAEGRLTRTHAAKRTRSVPRAARAAAKAG